MLFIDPTAQQKKKNWLHLERADFPFSQAPFSSKVGVFHSQSTCFRVARWPEGLCRLPQGLRKSVLAFLLVILQVKGILIYISQSSLLPAKSENTSAVGQMYNMLPLYFLNTGKPLPFLIRFYFIT